MVDPEVREIFMSGAVLGSRSLPNGEANKNWPASHQGMGYVYGPTGTTGTATSGTDTYQVNPFVTQLNPLTATFQIAPKGLPTPLTVLVTPFMPYTASVTGVGKPSVSVMMADSSSAGILVVRDPVGTEEFDDPARDIRSLKIRERWGMATANQGRGIAISKNVVIDRNYVFENTHTVSTMYTEPTGTQPGGATY
jgi:hypothetical protein